MCSMCPVKSKRPCFVWTIGPSLFLIQQLRSIPYSFSSQGSLSVVMVLHNFFGHQFFSSAIFPHNMHHSITFSVQRRCQSSSLYIQSLSSLSVFPFVFVFSHPIPLSLSHQSRSRVLDATGRDLLTDLIQCRQIPGLAEKNPYAQFLFQINYFLYCFSFLTPLFCSDKSCCSCHCCCSYWLGLKDPTEATA